MDLANDPNELYDLFLDSGSNDLAAEPDIMQCVLHQVMEALELGKADDIDYPGIYSRQRLATNSDESDDRYRVRDAERILSLNPLIDPDSIDAELTSEKRLSLNFRLKSGQILKNFIMR